MASMSTQISNSSNSSSSETPRRSYDVFLSFRGEDVRGNFLEHLYRALRQKGIFTFKDDDRLRGGETIKDGLMEAIEESRCSIVVLSKNYANSSWCLNELVHILQCNKTMNHVIHPVFYHVEPSDVRHIRGEFGEGFAKAASKNDSKVQKWLEALEKIANLKGSAFPSSEFKTEADLIDKVVHTIFSNSIETYRTPLEGLVGIESRMKEVIKLLYLGSEETRVVGLWGMGGIGKTTLARAVYDTISWKFEGFSFIDNVTEVLNKSGVLALQKHLISDISMEKDFEVRNVMRGTSIIQNMISRKKVLIVLDNVSEPEQLENVLGELHCFSPGSRIIITTQNQQVLIVHRVQHIFKVQELEECEAIELFKSKAFAENEETKEFRMVIDRAVQYAKGVPLALKVLGSFLMGETVEGWESALARVRESSDDKLHQVLRISFDGLHELEKDIFLDIACFFRGMDKERVIKILESCGFKPVIGLDVLVRKSLLTISVDNKLLMHDLVQQMGWSIVDEESRKEPGERSRLWRPNDVKDVLMDNTGTKKVEGVLFYPRNMPEKLDAFAKMTNMRVLMIHGSWCSIDLPNKLRLFFWHGCPLKCMPSAFQPQHLVELRLTNSHIEQLWDKTMVLPKLRLMDLGHSTSLTKGPDITGFPNLEDLVFEGCTSLVDIHPSIKKLRKLMLLNLKGCSSLPSLPSGIESRCFKTLIFSGCLKLTNVLECFVDLKQLSHLNFVETGITELPESIGDSVNLDYLDLSGCEKLKSLPSSIGKLKKLKKLLLNGCCCLSEFPEEAGYMNSLEILDISFSRLVSFPESVLVNRVEKLIPAIATTVARCNFSEIVTPSGAKFNVPIGLSPGSLLQLASFLKIVEISSPMLRERPTPVFRKISFTIPRTIGQLKNLKQFSLIGCKSFTDLPEEVGRIDSLEILDISFSGITQIPDSVVHLRNLQILGCSGCTSINNLSIIDYSGIKSLTSLDLSHCHFESIPESIGFCFPLKTLNLSQNNFRLLPANIKNLSNLEKLLINECHNLEQLPELPPGIREVLAFGCISLETIRNPTAYTDARKFWFADCPKLVGNEEINILMGYKFLITQIKENKRQSSRVYTGPGHKIPDWIDDPNDGGSITPIHVFNAFNLSGFAFSAVVATKGQKCNIGMHMEVGGKIYNFGDFFTFSPDSENVIVLFYPINYFTIDEFDMGEMKVCFVTAEDPGNKGFYTTEQTLQPALEVKECGVRLIYEDEFAESE